jgi:hypothetical protein
MGEWCERVASADDSLPPMTMSGPIVPVAPSVIGEPRSAAGLPSSRRVGP